MNALTLQQPSFPSQLFISSIMLEDNQLIEATRQTADAIYNAKSCVDKTLQQLSMSTTDLSAFLKEIEDENALLQKTQEDEILALKETSAQLDATLASQETELEQINTKLNHLTDSIRVIKNECSIPLSERVRLASIRARKKGWKVLSAHSEEFAKIKQIYPNDFCVTIPNVIQKLAVRRD